MICPKCKQELIQINKTYKCCNNHSFDIAKENYINLLLSKPNSGDNKLLVDSRINFLSKNYYYPLAKKIIDITKQLNITNILDCGCGTGYYTNILSEFYQTYGLDISKLAIIHASKNDKKTEYVVASNKEIPYKDHFFDCLLYVFSPIFEDESIRVLRENGYIILVTPNLNHLYEIKKLLYTNPYKKDKNNLAFKSLSLLEQDYLNYQILLDKNDITNLISMTPYFYKTDKDSLDNLDISNSINVTVDFTISIYKSKA